MILQVNNRQTRLLFKEEELVRSKASEIGELPGRFETSPAVLGAMQSLALYRRPDNYYETLVDQYRAQTREGLDTAARSALDPDGFVWIVVGDAEKVRGQLAPLGLPIEERELPATE